MRVRTLAALYIIMAILFIMAVAAQVYTTDVMKPTSVFRYLIVTTLITGIFASGLIKRMNVEY